MSDARTYSIQVRLQRTTVEDGYVSVPITGAVTMQHEDGSTRVDGAAVFAAALRMGADPRVEWKAETTQVQVHPLQMERPENRSTLDGFYDLPQAND